MHFNGNEGEASCHSHVKVQETASKASSKVQDSSQVQLNSGLMALATVHLSSASRVCISEGGPLQPFQ